MRQFAVKRLTKSDLTFFEWHFREHPAGNQKAINLNKDVFIDELYPDLGRRALTGDSRFGIDLRIYGPGLSPEECLQRKIVKGATYKNWRLNGEFVYNPHDQPERFNVLCAEDLAVFEFSGETEPQKARVFLIAQNDTHDAELYSALNQLIGQRRMAKLSYGELKNVILEADCVTEHPINTVIDDEGLIQITTTGSSGHGGMTAMRPAPRISPKELSESRATLESIGHQGESWVNEYLMVQRNKGLIGDVDWTSQEYATAPYDFTVTDSEKSILIDAKSTIGDFNRSIHISYNEIRCMAESSSCYSIFRVYEMSENSAKLRIAEDVRQYAESIIAGLEHLPSWATPNGFSIDPDALSFEDEILLTKTENSVEDDEPLS